MTIDILIIMWFWFFLAPAKQFCKPHLEIWSWFYSKSIRKLLIKYDDVPKTKQSLELDCEDNNGSDKNENRYLDNYFNRHDCLSIRSSIHVCVYPKTNSSFCSRITKCH